MNNLNLETTIQVIFPEMYYLKSHCDPKYADSGMVEVSIHYSPQPLKAQV